MLGGCGCTCVQDRNLAHACLCVTVCFVCVCMLCVWFLLATASLHHSKLSACCSILNFSFLLFSHILYPRLLSFTLLLRLFLSLSSFLTLSFSPCPSSFFISLSLFLPFLWNFNHPVNRHAFQCEMWFCYRLRELRRERERGREGGGLCMCVWEREREGSRERVIVVSQFVLKRMINPSLWFCIHLTGCCSMSKCVCACVCICTSVCLSMHNACLAYAVLHRASTSAQACMCWSLWMYYIYIFIYIFIYMHIHTHRNIDSLWMGKGLRLDPTVCVLCVHLCVCRDCREYTLWSVGVQSE